jgi:hypothetical protein
MPFTGDRALVLHFLQRCYEEHHMKVKIEKHWGHNAVSLTQGNQQFFLDYAGSIAECRWYARMFRIALKNHDAEQTAKRMKDKKPA